MSQQPLEQTSPISIRVPITDANTNTSTSTSTSTNTHATPNSNFDANSISNVPELRRLLPQPVRPPLPSADYPAGTSAASSSSSGSGSGSGAGSSSSSVPSFVKRPRPVVSRLRVRAKQVDVACEACRKHKVKCTAERPRCRRCSRRDEDCHYEIPEFGKDRYEALKRSYNDLVSDRESCQKLFNLLETAGVDESQHILGQIREGQDATSVLRHVLEANLLVGLSGGLEDEKSGSGSGSGPA